MRPERSVGDPRDPFMPALVGELMQASVHGFSPSTRAGLFRDDGEQLCSHPEHPALAPLVHRQLRLVDADLPPRLRESLRRQSRLTRECNSLLLGKLAEICARFSDDRIPVMVIKGPALARLTSGLLVRPFHDLDLLVHRHRATEAAQALRSLGYEEVHTAARHEFHRIFAHAAARGAAIVELHFDLGDSQRAIVPDVAGIWHRSALADLARCSVHAPGVTDHFLLTIMQLPDHGWTLRLLADAGLIISRWEAAIDWGGLLDTARAWGMWAVTASALYALDSMFGISAPETVRHAIRPAGYLRRAQWHLVMDAVAARLAGDPRARAVQLARLLTLDRVGGLGALLARRIGSAPDPRIRQRALAETAWRIAAGASNLPALARVLVKGMNRRPSALPQHSPRSVHGGQR